MGDNAEVQGDSPSDSSIIRKLRADLKEAEAKAKSTEATVRAQVEREQRAGSLMPKGFEGLADVFEREVEGELSTEAAAEWLTQRGINVTPNEEVEGTAPVAPVAAGLQEVTDLGAAAAAASNLTPTDTILDNIRKADEGFAGAGSLPDVTKALEAALNG
jgi:hypothetical protein